MYMALPNVPQVNIQNGVRSNGLRGVWYYLVSCVLHAWHLLPGMYSAVPCAIVWDHHAFGRDVGSVERGSRGKQNWSLLVRLRCTLKLKLMKGRIDEVRITTWCCRSKIWDSPGHCAAPGNRRLGIRKNWCASNDGEPELEVIVRASSCCSGLIGSCSQCQASTSVRNISDLRS